MGCSARYGGWKRSLALPCPDSPGSFASLRAERQARRWDAHLASPSQAASRSPSLPRGDEHQDASKEEGTETATWDLVQSQVKGSETADPGGLKGCLRCANRPVSAISPNQTRKSRVPRCSHTSVTRTSKLIAESLNVSIGKAEMQ